MPVNPYFSQQVRSEQTLYDSLITEAIQMYGQDLYYLPREIVNKDTLLDQITHSKFNSAYLIEMYIETVNGFEGTGDLYSKFGFEIRDQVRFSVSRRRWEQFVGNWDKNNEVDRPREGDLIYLPLSNSFFEIKFVEDEVPFYQHSKMVVYQLVCESFEFNDEEFDTGIDTIDSLERYAAQRQYLRVTLHSGGTDFAIGDIVSQTLPNGITVSAEIALRRTLDAETNLYMLKLINQINNSTGWHSFTTSNISGSPKTELLSISNKSIEFIVNEVYNLDSDVDEIDASVAVQSQNQIIENKANDVIDFSETNPFGEV